MKIQSHFFSLRRSAYTCIFFTSFLLLFACTEKESNLGGIGSGNVGDMAMCAGGMEQGLSSDLEAALQKSGGKVTASFTQSAKGLIFNNPDIASSDKASMYSTYIECIYKMQDKQAKINGCQSLKDSCMTTANTVFQQCIRSEMRGCFNDCRYRGFPRDACVLQLCNYSRMTEDSKDFYNDRCSVKEDYMNKESECAEIYSQCITSQG